jgi:carboxypeptidase C (cathepsin A)
MRAPSPRHLLPLVGLVGHTAAQFPPTPSGLTVLDSKFHPGVKISYKSPSPSLCETTPGVRSYSGYVHLPAHTLTELGAGAQPYPINTFFWFFEARTAPHTAPLAIWLNGGPGGSSLAGALAENGPCFVNRDSNSTAHNPWSWNNEANVLYIDQPNQVGYSYGVPTNVTVDLLVDPESFGPDVATKVVDFAKEGVPETNATFLVGTVGSQNGSWTANSTHGAAVALWHFAQTWFEEFPEYKPADERVSLATESYGGQYGPSFMEYWQRQNEGIRNGTIEGPGAHVLQLDTLLIINGCADAERQTRFYAEFAWNNTYGVRAIEESEYHWAMWETGRKGGVEDQIRECHRMASEIDPGNSGAVREVNEVCMNATAGMGSITAPYLRRGKNGWFDITHPLEDPLPSMEFVGFLNQHWVQKELGVPVNFTFESATVADAFRRTGDFARGGELERMAYLLESGVKVHLLYGDRDYACNWRGGEAVSTDVPFRGQQAFNEAGYQTLVTNQYYSGGRVRQYGNFSFSRVFQAGHMVPSCECIILPWLSSARNYGLLTQ